MSVKNVSLTIDSTDSQRLHIRGTCCQDNFTVNASSLAGLRCETSQGVVAANHEVVDEVVNEEVIEDGSNDAHRNESESNEEPITNTSSNIGLVVGIAVGSAAVIVAVAVGAMIFKACNGKNNKLSQKDTFQNVDMSTPAYNSAKMHYNYRY
ncbi:uncharacterized protein LOC117315553 [Pecten maximus]|uniref:uncharacterized protein LOC117315553 n=1 Tax=Pecten maximus TaxID=6579 RepID=UPI0014587AE9|nr:uncharacterized protein LOC117315553 [Pecten maximus]